MAIRDLVLAPGKPPNGNARRIPPCHLLTTYFPHRKVQTALDDTKQVLFLWPLVGDDTAVKPSDGSLHGFFHSLSVGRGGCDDIV